MRLIDLSQPVFDGSPNCPSHPPVRVEVIEWHVPSGKETWHLELLKMATHTGSHVDVPLHKFLGGAPLESIPLEHWRGPARLADFRGIAPRANITAAMLAEKLGDRSLRDAYCLLATGWGQKRAKTHDWLHDAPSLGADGAAWLVERGARGVGIDHWSIGSAVTHATLLAKPVLIVEELFFPEEVYSLKTDAEFWALPINFRGMGGAPCRPVLVVPDGAPGGSGVP
jgi:arylformamidase